MTATPQTLEAVAVLLLVLAVATFLLVLFAPWIGRHDSRRRYR